MVAGFGTFFKQEFEIPNIIGALIIIALAITVFRKGIDGVEKINFILIPFIIIAICFLKHKTGAIELKDLIPSEKTSWLIKSILYASYNSIILIPILINLNKKINKKRDAIKISMGTFAITSVLSISIFSIIQKNYVEIINAPMPLITIAGSYGKIYKYIYSFVILTAIFTTAISSGYSLLKNLAKNKKQYIILTYIISVIAIILSPIGFGKLLDLLYPILGYLGLMQIFILMILN